MDVRAAALTEPEATALHALDLASRTLARPIPECNALVIGGGAIGLLTALLLRSYGAREIWMAETNALRRSAAQRAVPVRAYGPLAPRARRCLGASRWISPAVVQPAR